MKEDKQLITKLLLGTLKVTRAGWNIVDMNYNFRDDGDEVVIIQYINGAEKRVNVSCDSGAGLIRDVMQKV